MLTIISFLLTLIGSVNWLMIGLLQYDFIAGIFGYQASVFSRIIYILIGASSAVIIYKLIKGKGTLFVLSKRNKKDFAKKIEKMQNGDQKDEAIDIAPSAYNVESGQDYYREQERSNKPPRGLFDEHFDDRS